MGALLQPCKVGNMSVNSELNGPSSTNYFSMKIGNTVELIHNFDIDSYEENTKTFAISIKTPGGKVHWTIPIYIGILGIYPSGNRFVVPGDYLPKEHPDYYKVIDQNKLIVELKGSAYRVIIDEGFFYNGFYRLEPMDRQLVPIMKRAFEYSEEKMNEICYDLVGSEINSEVIRGVAVRLYANKEKEVRYYESFPNLIVKSSANKYVVVHDEDTNIEYPLPYEYLKVKT
jgi:hypothetical protein